MKPVLQTCFEAGKGNCLAACVASILELPLEALPDLNARGPHWQQTVLDDWLAQFGLGFLKFPAGTAGFADGTYYIGSGLSRRGFRHSVVCKDGEMLHDPHPDGTGVVDDKFDYFGVFFLVDPARYGLLEAFRDTKAEPKLYTSATKVSPSP